MALKRKAVHATNDEEHVDKATTLQDGKQGDQSLKKRKKRDKRKGESEDDGDRKAGQKKKKKKTKSKEPEVEGGQELQNDQQPTLPQSLSGHNPNAEPEPEPAQQTPQRYQQAKSLDAVPESDIGRFLCENQISVTDPSGANPLRPILKFAHLPPSTLLAQSPFAGFAAPTPIQSASWPFALSGRDVVGVAETGSGKTLAFSLPCVEAVHSVRTACSNSGTPIAQKHDRVARAVAVILSPTRELAMQTHATISNLAALVGLKAVCLYGGASKDDQRALLRRPHGADIIVATPGRLKDFMSEGAVCLASATFVVLDEADRMLDKGFEEDVRLILGQCPNKQKRQTLMFTATWPVTVKNLAESFMQNPIMITSGRKSLANQDDANESSNGSVELQANSRISQTVEVVGHRDKEFRTLQLLRDAQKGSGKTDRILVFCLYKKEAVRVETFLRKSGILVTSIHGDLKQEQRTRSLEAFKAGTTPVLVATDVAARGLDIPEVKLVINVTVGTPRPHHS